MNNFIDFMNKSVCNFYAVNNIKNILLDNGYLELKENENWPQLLKGNKYFITRNNTSIIAFNIPSKIEGINLTASHSDSPTFKIKPNNLISDGIHYKLNVEVYGGPILSTWLDRPLSFAGRVIFLENNKIKEKFINVDKDLFVIPNIAPHLFPEVSKGMQYNPQIHMLPLISLNNKLTIEDIIANELNIKNEAILNYDLYLVNRFSASLLGYNNDLVISPRLDDLACVYTSLKAFVSAKNDNKMNMFACFDNEEVGSHTRQGAASDFLDINLDRIFENLGKTIEEKNIILAKSFMLSCDNAHAVSPSMPEKTDSLNKVYPNKGVVIKYNANQSYTTDGYTSALLKKLAKDNNILLQEYTNRSDIRGGSTLGNISNTHISLHSCDIGLAQYAMHSSTEVCGVKDISYMISLLTKFYESNLL